MLRLSKAFLFLSVLGLTFQLQAEPNISESNTSESNTSQVIPTAVPTEAKPMKSVELEWEEVPGAVSYILRLQPSIGGEPLYLTSEQAHLKEQIPLGVYKLQIRSRGKQDDVLSPWSEAIQLEVVTKELLPLSPKNEETVEAQSLKEQTVDFTWTPVDQVKVYNLKIWSDDQNFKPVIFKTRTTKKSLGVRPGHRYFWQVSFESANSTSYAQTPATFSFQLIGERLLSPTDLQLTRKDADQILNWRPATEAQLYKAKLLFHYLDESHFAPLKPDLSATLKTTEWNTGKLKPGVYRLELTASARNRTDSEPVLFDFVVKPLETDLALGAAGD